MTVRELLEKYPNAIVEDNIIFEGYGDGRIPLEQALDEDVNFYYYDEQTKDIEIYV